MNSNDSREINSSIRIAVDNANKRIDLLSFSDRKCVIEEYKEWINEDINCHEVLFLRKILLYENNRLTLSCFRSYFK